jgi:hypothetical protein
MAEHSHLFVRRKGRGIPFRGVSPVVPPVRVQRGDRRAHAEALVEAVEAAVERNAQRIAEQVLLPEAERGFYLSFEAPSATPMPLKFFESSRRGIDLLSVEVDDGKQTANVFMRAAKADRFKRATEAYAESESGVGDRPSNEEFFDRVERIRSATEDRGLDTRHRAGARHQNRTRPPDVSRGGRGARPLHAPTTA